MVVTTTVRFRFDCNSTALHSFDDLHSTYTVWTTKYEHPYWRTPKCVIWNRPLLVHFICSINTENAESGLVSIESRDRHYKHILLLLYVHRCYVRLIFCTLISHRRFIRLKTEYNKRTVTLHNVTNVLTNVLYNLTWLLSAKKVMIHQH